jgi:hypothetical protein
MDYIITGKAPAGTRYNLRQPAGYPAMIGAMFWTIDADRRGNYEFSNVVGPLLHGYPGMTAALLGTILLLGCIYLATRLAVLVMGVGQAPFPPLPKDDSSADSASGSHAKN